MPVFIPWQVLLNSHCFLFHSALIWPHIFFWWFRNEAYLTSGVYITPILQRWLLIRPFSSTILITYFYWISPPQEQLLHPSWHTWKQTSYVYWRLEHTGPNHKVIQEALSNFFPSSLWLTGPIAKGQLWLCMWVPILATLPCYCSMGSFCSCSFLPLLTLSWESRKIFPNTRTLHICPKSILSNNNSKDNI